MAVTIPTTQYIGVNTHRSTDGSMPLAFLTPGGTNAAAKKRMGTVDNWLGKNSVNNINIPIAEKEQFEKDNPTAVWRCDNTHNPEYLNSSYAVPRVEDVDWKIFDNVPNEARTGFRITKSISRGGGWSGSNKVVRIEDPRGFELEISVDNLVKMMSMTTFIDGVCQEKCVWGRDGSTNVLLPVNSDPYKEAYATTEYRNKKAISLRDVQIGDLIELKKSEHFAGLTGRYMGSYHVYYLNDLHEVRDTSSRYYGSPPDYTMMKIVKRYILQINNKDGDLIGYQGVATAKVHRIIERVESPWPRPDIDAKDFKDVSYSNNEHPALLTTKKHDILDILRTVDYIPLEFDIVQKAAETKSSGPLFAWAREPESGLRMRYYRDYKSPYGHGNEVKESKAERDKVFTGQVTRIHKDQNKWDILREHGRSGVGPLALLKDSSQKSALSLTDYQWFQLVFTIDGVQYKVPVKTDKSW